MLYDPTWKIRFCIVPPKFGLRFHMYPPRWSKRFCMVPPKFPQLGISDIPVISCKNSINKHISNIMYVLVSPISLWWPLTSWYSASSWSRLPSGWRRHTALNTACSAGISVRAGDSGKSSEIELPIIKFSNFFVITTSFLVIYIYNNHSMFFTKKKWSAFP